MVTVNCSGGAEGRREGDKLSLANRPFQSDVSLGNR